ncbi:MAG: DNA-directed RNA polymerase subunit alpha [Patescibacteria group bacterium]
MIQLPTEPKLVSKVDNKAIFEIAPLYPGYGITIGNSLRRVLISSISGAAITSVKIKGVDHEFTTIPGVMEDILEIIMNLKRVRFKVFIDEPVTLTLSAKGAGDITANNIAETADVEVVNPDQKIATITDKKTEVEMEIKVEKGVGYVPVEQRHKEKLTVGEIAIDGIFTPIRNVHYTVENIRVGQRTDYNKIILEIETDGSISPEETLQTASQIMLDHFQIMHAVQLPEKVEKKVVKEKKTKKKKDE